MSITKLLVEWVERYSGGNEFIIGNGILQNNVIADVQYQMVGHKGIKPNASTIERKWRMVVEKQLCPNHLITPSKNDGGYRIWIVKRRKQESMRS